MYRVFSDILLYWRAFHITLLTQSNTFVKIFIVENIRQLFDVLSKWFSSNPVNKSLFLVIDHVNIDSTQQRT